MEPNYTSNPFIIDYDKLYYSVTHSGHYIYLHASSSPYNHMDFQLDFSGQAHFILSHDYLPDILPNYIKPIMSQKVKVLIHHIFELQDLDLKIQGQNSGNSPVSSPDMAVLYRILM